MNDFLKQLGFTLQRDDEGERYILERNGNYAEVYQDDAGNPDSWFVFSGVYFAGPFSLQDAAMDAESLVR